MHLYPNDLKVLKEQQKNPNFNIKEVRRPSQKRGSVSQDQGPMTALIPAEREAHEKYSFLTGKIIIQGCQTGIWKSTIIRILTLHIFLITTASIDF